VIALEQEIEARRADYYAADDLRDIDEAVADVRRAELVTDEEVAKFRNV
jgi:hypothetical protein